MEYFSEKAQDSGSRDWTAMEVDLLWENVPLTSRIEELAVKFKPAENSDFKSFDLIFISDVEPPFGVYCTCHGHIENGALSSFRAIMRRKPKLPPSSELIEASTSLGGYPVGLDAFFVEFKGHITECDADAVIVSSDAELVKLRPRSNEEAVLPFKRKADNVTLEGPNGADVDIEFFEEGVSLMPRADISLKMDGRCFEAACEALMLVISPIFTAK
jgi:hypothetical protein